MAIAWLVFACCLAVVSCEGPLCYSCSKVYQPQECDRVIHCQQNEICHTQMFIDSTFTAYYTLGCVEKEVCSTTSVTIVGKRDSSIENLPKRQVSDPLVSLKCCDGSFCNLDLYGSNSTRNLKRCLHCDLVNSPESCNRAVECGDDTLCYVQSLSTSTITYHYNMGCMPQLQCQAASNVYQNTGCWTCCNHDYCNLDACVNGAWSSWQPWTSCSVTCGSGKQTRARDCDNPPPQFNGRYCVGNSTDVQTCTLSSCQVNGGWSDWGAWSACVKTCGSDAEQRRERHCNNPPPQFGGATCAGHDAQTSPCNLTMCPDELCHSYGFSMFTDSKTHTDLCLKLFKSAVTWHQARAQCESHSAHLVTVTSQAKDNAIHTFLHGEYIARAEYVWVGLSGMGAHKHDYMWVTAEPLGYSGALDMKAAMENSHGHHLVCGVVLWTGHDSQWWAEACDAYLYEYLCEINV